MDNSTLSIMLPFSLFLSCFLFILCVYLFGSVFTFNVCKRDNFRVHVFDDVLYMFMSVIQYNYVCLSVVKNCYCRTVVLILQLWQTNRYIQRKLTVTYIMRCAVLLACAESLPL